MTRISGPFLKAAETHDLITWNVQFLVQQRPTRAKGRRTERGRDTLLHHNWMPLGYV